MTIGKVSIKPTKHYLDCHADVEWDFVILAVLSPDKVKPDKRYGKSRFTYIKNCRNFIIKVHTERDSVEEVIWVINAFKTACNSR